MSASESVAQRLRLGEVVSLYEDEWRTPIDPQSVAEAIQAVLARPSARGIFHLGGAVRLSRAELGEQVAATFGLDPGLIRRTTRSAHQGAPRARDVSLDTTRAREELNWTPRPLDVVLREGRND